MEGARARDREDKGENMSTKAHVLMSDIGDIEAYQETNEPQTMFFGKGMGWNVYLLISNEKIRDLKIDKDTTRIVLGEIPKMDMGQIPEREIEIPNWHILSMEWDFEEFMFVIEGGSQTAENLSRGELKTTYQRVSK